MKTVFNITNNQSQLASTSRIVEISEEQLAFIYYSVSPYQVQQIKIFALDKKEGKAHIAAQLKECFTLENEAQAEIVSNSIYVNNKELTLVPQNLHKPENDTELLNFIFGEDANSVIQNEALPATEIQLIYRLPKEIASVVGEFFPGSLLKHSVSKQFKIPADSAAQIFCLVGYSYAKIFVFNNNQFLLQRYFHYVTADDMAYQLLNTCTQLNVNVEEVQLKLSEFIEPNSNLYAALHKYFLNIEFETTGENLHLNSEAEVYPPHLFFPLFQLLPNENN